MEKLYLPIPRYFLNLGIVQLVFGPFWARRMVLIECDNMAVISVLTYGRTRDAFLATSAGNVWQIVATYDIEAINKHVLGANNYVTDLLSRWKGTPADITNLQAHV